MEPTNATETQPLMAVPVDGPPAYPERGCFEIDLACLCCSLQQGAKVMLILTVVEGVMICMSIGSIGAFTLPVFLLGVFMIVTALYGFWAVQKEDTTKLAIIGWSFMFVALAVAASTVGRLYQAEQHCDQDTSNCDDDETYYYEDGSTYTCQERADATRDSCIHAHYVNAVLVAATTFPTSAFLVLICWSLINKHNRGEPLARGSLFDELEDEFGSTRQAQPVQSLPSAETSVMGRPVVAGKQLWALPFFKTKLRPPDK